MNHFGSEQENCVTCIDPAPGFIEEKRTLAMELKKAADAGNSLEEKTDRLYCILFGGGMAERNCCDPAQSFAEDLDRLVDTLCRTCDLMEKILTMVG